MEFSSDLSSVDFKEYNFSKLEVPDTYFVCMNLVETFDLTIHYVPVKLVEVVDGKGKIISFVRNYCILKEFYKSK